MAVSSVGSTPTKVTNELNKKIKSLQSGKLVDLMIVEPKTKVINVEYQSEVKEDSITKIKAHLVKQFGVIGDIDTNKIKVGRVVKGKNVSFDVNFNKRKPPEEGRKQTPTQYQEKGTTDVFNNVLERNKRYKSIADMRKDTDLMKDIRDTFSGKTAKKNVGDHRDKVDDWMNTFFNQQDLFFMQKYAPSKWSRFEYHREDWVKFW